MVCNCISNDIDLVQPTQYIIPKKWGQKSYRQSPNHYLRLASLLFKTDNAAEWLTAVYALYLIGAHGPQFIGRSYRCKGNGT